MLPTPEAGDPLAVSIKVYLFGTPQSIQITISRMSKVADVIRHLMTVCHSGENPLKYPKNPEAYELRLIDDDEPNSFKPFY